MIGSWITLYDDTSEFLICASGVIAKEHLTINLLVRFRKNRDLQLGCLSQLKFA